MKRIIPFFVISFFWIQTGFAETTYVIARAPQLSSLHAAKNWTPFVDYLAKQTGYRFSLKLYTEREKFEHDLAHNNFDIFYGNPGYMIVAHDLHHFAPLIRSDKEGLKGIIVVPSDSSFNSVLDLNNEILAFPDETAFAASLYLRSILRDSHGLKFDSIFVGGHDNVYRNVVAGAAAAGGGVYRTLEKEPDALKSRLRVLYETPGMASHPLAVRGTVPPQVREALVRAILALENSEQGRQMLASVNLSQPVRADYGRDYAPFRNIARKMYAVLFSHQ